VDSHGGVAGLLDLFELGDFSAVFVSMAGLLDPKALPCPHAEPLLLPPVQKLLQRRFHSGVFMVALQLNVLVRRLRGEFGEHGDDKPLSGMLVASRCRSVLAEFQNGNGSWNDNVTFAALALAALWGTGLDAMAPSVSRGLEWLKGRAVRDAHGLHFDASSTEVWTTAFDVRALLSSNVPPSDPSLHRALNWLADAQLKKPMPAVDNRQPRARLTGGWAFQRTNDTLPDCDDTGVVLSAFGAALSSGGCDAELTAKLRDSSAKGREWLLGMQNPDGGWSAFVWGLPGKARGAILKQTPRAKLDSPLSMARLLLDPPASMGDPSTEDVTARALHGLGKQGFTTSSPEVARALEFLRKQQCESGAFWGRWVVNYLSATAFVLMGLSAVAADLSAGWVQRAIRFVLSKQNPDGGWGEKPESYRDEALAGIGPSMPPLTGLVLQGLIDAGLGQSPAVARGVAYLLRHQKPDGSWANAGYLHTNVPPDTFYVIEEAARFYPTEALAKYAAWRSSRHGPSPKPTARFTQELLTELRQHTDPPADEVVLDIFRRGKVDAVNALLSNLFRSDDPVPAGLPPEAERYFEATSKLPGWADAAKLQIAQRLFTRNGWEVAMALFCSSLPQAYAAGRGAEVLTQTQELTRHTRQRIFETAQFVFDAMDEGAFDENGRGIRSAQKVRLLHAAIRHLINSRPTPAWDRDKLGPPINQEDLGGTLMTFSVVTLEGLHSLGIPVTDTEAEAWIHAWNVAGHFLGIRPELLPDNLAQAEELMSAIRERQWGRSAAGKRLIRPLIQMMQEYFPGTALDGLPIALVRHLAGDECGDLLGLPPADWTKLLVDAAPALGAIIPEEQTFAPLPLYRRANHVLMEAIVRVSREGKDVRFRIPRSLLAQANAP
ncbi:MAG: prenyltransferase/squalene oxidase repeat-containing protein, partial [Myxococcaceae bacterium]